MLRHFQEDWPIPARPYPELRTWMVVRSYIISVFTWHSVTAPASPDVRPTPSLRPTCLPTTTSIPAPSNPPLPWLTTQIHQLWLTRPPSTRSSCVCVGHPQAPVVIQQLQHSLMQFQSGLSSLTSFDVKCLPGKPNNCISSYNSEIKSLPRHARKCFFLQLFFGYQINIWRYL